MTFLESYPDNASASASFLDPDDPNLVNIFAEIYFLPKTTLTKEEWIEA